MSCVATTGMMLQFALDDGKRPALRFRDLKECFRSRASQASRELRIGVQAVDTLDVVDRRPATVIADTIEAHEFIDRLLHLIGAATSMGLHILAPREIFERDTESQHA